MPGSSPASVPVVVLLEAVLRFFSSSARVLLRWGSEPCLSIYRPWILPAPAPAVGECAPWRCRKWNLLRVFSLRLVIFGHLCSDVVFCGQRVGAGGSKFPPVDSSPFLAVAQGCLLPVPILRPPHPCGGRGRGRGRTLQTQRILGPRSWVPGPRWCRRPGFTSRRPSLLPREQGVSTFPGR